MKIRCDFVTNSSSSSFTIICEVDYNEKLKHYLKEEFGNYGVRLAESYIKKGSVLNDNDYDSIKEILEDNGEAVDTNKYYLEAEFITYSDDGEQEGDDAWLMTRIPAEFKKEIYNGDC